MPPKESGKPSVKSQPSLSLFTIPKRRIRANTEELLGEKFFWSSDDLPKPPLPQQNSDGYTLGHVKEGLIYATLTLTHPKRKLPPIGQVGLKIFKETCKDFIELETNTKELDDGSPPAKKKMRLEYISSLKLYERDLQSVKCFRLLEKEKDKQAEMQEELVKLRRLAFYVRYGDYLAEACTRLRETAEAKKVEGWGILSGQYWTEIAKKLSREKPHWELLMDNKKKPKELEIPTHLAVQAASTYTGFDLDDNLKIIEEYAKRNTLVHLGIAELIKAGLRMK